MIEVYEDETIKNLRDYYFNTIMKLQFEEDILEALPEISYYSFFPLIDGIIGSLDNDIDDLEKLDEEELTSEYKEELELLYFKRSLCEQRKKEALDVLEDEKNALESDGERNLIFATTDVGNVYFEKDLKDITKEHYDLIIEALNILSSGNISRNPEHAHSLTADLNGLRELKTDHFRIIYCVLDADSFFVVQVKSKKADFSKKDHDELVDRKGKIDPQLKKYRKLFKDSRSKSELVKLNLPIKERVLKYLEVSKRGAKHGK